MILSMFASAALCGADNPGPTLSERAVRFRPAGAETITLEGLLHTPAAATTSHQAGLVPGVVICHPDPRYGGSMAVPVVTALQRGFAQAGFATLRFNLRGVGGSEGSFDAGDGEVLDCHGAVEFLRGQPGVDPARVSLAGYSFGAWVGLQACVRDGTVPVCACLGFPVPAEEPPGKHNYLGRLSFPVLFLTGTEDDISSLVGIHRLILAHNAAKFCTVDPLDGADHFLVNPDHLAAAVRRMVGFVAERVGAALPNSPASSR